MLLYRNKVSLKSNIIIMQSKEIIKIKCYTKNVLWVYNVYIDI